MSEFILCRVIAKIVQKKLEAFTNLLRARSTAKYSCDGYLIKLLKMVQKMTLWR